ncbi:MAG: excinuclease ABC subunit UvrA [Gemmatimonadales bacterium]|nr:excinuclease ABC subunit UvrA [Gemmatimonadales bacterium]
MGEEKEIRTGSPAGFITLKGVRVHNLKNLDLQLPRRRLVVVTGPSGSGKSSLAFDTLYAEGQRRYIESLSSYAHQFLDQLPKPDVDRIDGLSPALAIDQKGLGRSPRSTVGTVTEIYNFLRLLFARCGTVYCPECEVPAAGRQLGDIQDEIACLPKGTRFYLLAPVVRGRKGEHKKLLEDLQKQGFLRALVDGELRELEEDIKLARNQRHDVAVVVDGLTSRPGIRERLKAALDQAAEIGDGTVVVWSSGKETIYSRHSSCPGCGRGFPEFEPRQFSFNSPAGSCEHCNGLGSLRTILPEAMVPDPSLSLVDGAVEFLKGKETSWLYVQIEALAGALGFDLEAPFSELDSTAKEVLFQGFDKAVRADLKNHPHYNAFLRDWEGLVPELVRRHRETRSEAVRVSLEKLMIAQECPVCRGHRLRAESLNVRIGGLHIGQAAALTLEEFSVWVEGLVFSGEREILVAAPILDQIKSRLRFLLQVGVSYLSLSRPIGTLSGGEGQRVRLATQVGSQLTGVLYILDEPSVGLHHRDIGKLVSTLRALRDRGNSLVVVEHDRDIMLAADHIVDLGPGAGEHGGRIVDQGTVSEVMAGVGNATADYLAGRVGLDGPEPLTGGLDAKSDPILRISGMTGRNLKSAALDIPLGRLTVVTGVSGSGKSSAVHDTLYRALAAKLNRSRQPIEPYEGLTGVEHLGSVVLVDQSPIGRSPRSTPATYTGLYNHIRKIYAETNLARMRGYKTGRFSFNTAGGRCPVCEGAGLRRLTMDFLPDVEVLCQECGGRRFDRETLDVHFKGCDIARVLEMTVEEARELFENIPACRKILDVMLGVGLNYLRLGQSGGTLSGGEAQRIKLVKELTKGGRKHTLYILDEPTTGLHFCDVDRLMNVLGRLLSQGNTVMVIEHHPEIIRRADHIIDLGPEGGARGGRVLAAGSLADIQACEESYTGAMLRTMFPAASK